MITFVYRCRLCYKAFSVPSAYTSKDALAEYFDKYMEATSAIAHICDEESIGVGVLLGASESAENWLKELNPNE